MQPKTEKPTSVLEDYTEKDVIRWLVWTSIIILFAGFTFSFFVFLSEMNIIEWFFPYELSKVGAWGDTIGGILNPIFSFLALLGLLWTIRQQSKQLELSKDELEQSRIELRGSREANEMLVKAADQQNIENSFFQLFNFFTNMVENMQFTGRFGPARNGTFIGVKGFESFAGGIFSAIKKDCSEVPAHEQYSGNPNNWSPNGWEEILNKYGSEKEAMRALILRHYNFQYEQHQAELGRYFRVLFNILRFLSEKREVLPPSMVDTYIKLVRASLSNYELCLIFFNCLTKAGDDMKLYVAEFELFDNLPASIFKVTYDNEHGNEIGEIHLNNLSIEFEESSFGNNVSFFHSIL